MSKTHQLFTTEDSYGPVYVTDDGDCHILGFAPQDEQSRCLKSAPYILQHDYAQAMLLVLLFCQPKRVLVLGLGGGGLVTALHRYDWSLNITAVELRAAVIDIAKRFFFLPNSKRIQLVEQDADEFLIDDLPRKVDIIFADMYHAAGVDGLQLQTDFIARCSQQLKVDGWLVLNYWMEYSDDPYLREALKTHFADIQTVMTTSKNWVILASKTPQYRTSRELKDKATHLSSTLGYSLLRHLSRLRALGE